MKELVIWIMIDIPWLLHYYSCLHIETITGILIFFFYAVRNADYCKEELEACGLDFECIAKVLKNCPGK